ncbi:MAG TPA: SGNH/GDSL hydrolase family protein [Candidatus Paceibacterota bacterium]|nr:SGNH/GDSL hydrolase family protein [Candidatus Paceibacterota bacterium]
MNAISIAFAVCVGIVLGAVLFETLRITWYLCISRLMTLSTMRFERLDAPGTERILFVGDSTGYGTGTSHERYSLVGRLGADFPSAYIENCSKTGRKLKGAERLLRRKADDPAQRAFDLAIIMVGGMNVLYGTRLSAVRKMVDRMLAHAKRCSRTVVLVSSNDPGAAPLFRPPLSGIYRRRAGAFASVYAEAAHDAGVIHVSLFREHPDELVEKHLFSADKTHPNDAGYAVWYNRIKEAIPDIHAGHDGTGIE